MKNMSEETKKEIGRRIRSRKEAKGFKTRHMIERLRGVDSTSTYRGWENGSRTPNPEFLSQIASILETTVDYLTCKTDNPSPNYKESQKYILDEILKNSGDKEVTFEGKQVTSKEAAEIRKIIASYLENKYKEQTT